MEDINIKLIDNLLKQSELLLEKSILFSTDVKINKGLDIRGSIENKDNVNKIIDELIKESEQIIKNSSQVLNNITQIQELNNK